MLFLFLMTKLPCTTTEKVHYILKRVYRCCTAYFYLCFLIFPLYLCDMILRKHSYFRYICILIYSCLMPVLLHSQNVVKQISNADGLSNNSVNCFLEDSEHTLWVGTWDGLNATTDVALKPILIIKMQDLSVTMWSGKLSSKMTLYCGYLPTMASTGGNVPHSNLLLII